MERGNFIGEVAKAEWLLSQMHEEGLQPDGFSYTSVIGARARKGEAAESEWTPPQSPPPIFPWRGHVFGAAESGHTMLRI